MKNTYSTCGLYMGYTLITNDTPFVDYIEKSGAVVIARGNVPQFLFSMEATNNIYGTVSNPYDNKRSAGGSTGGDAVVVALK